MRQHYGQFLWLLLLCCLLPACAATDEVNTIALKLSGRDKCAFAFGMTQAGPITLKVDWQGAPLTIELFDGKGTSLAKLVSRAAPTATLTFTATPALLGSGKLWGCVISPPPSTATAAVATGTVTLTTPPVDRGQITLPKPPANFQVPAALLAQAKQKADAAFQTRLQAFTRDNTARLATVQSVAAARLQTAVQTQQSARAIRQQQLTAEMANVPRVTIGNPDTPRLTACSAREGGPGDQITLTGERLIGGVYLQVSEQQQLTIAGAVGNAENTQYRFALPQYAVAEWTRAYLCVKRRVGATVRDGIAMGGETLVSNRIPIWLMPTLPKVTECLPKGEGSATATTGPNATIYLYGSGFDARGQGEVHVKLSPTDDRVVRADAWSDCAVTATIPDLPPFTDPINAQVYVKCFGSASNQTPLTIVPDLELKQMDMTDVASYSIVNNHYLHVTCIDNIIPLPDQNLNTSALVTHFHSGMFTNVLQAYGDDIIYAGKALKNNWVVDNIDLQALSRADGAQETYLQSNSKGTSVLFAQLHWWSSPVCAVPIIAGTVSLGFAATFHPVVYQLRYTVKGPKGTSYK
jgi:hypothetical protein